MRIIYNKAHAHKSISLKVSTPIYYTFLYDTTNSNYANNHKIVLKTLKIILKFRCTCRLQNICTIRTSTKEQVFLAPFVSVKPLDLPCGTQDIMPPPPPAPAVRVTIR